MNIYGLLDAQEWRDLAAEAFTLGMRDAAKRSNPRNSIEVMAELTQGTPRIPDMVVLHRQKIRQVYGAGFDIARFHIREYEKLHREVEDGGAA